MPETPEIDYEAPSQLSQEMIDAEKAELRELRNKIEEKPQPRLIDRIRQRGEERRARKEQERLAQSRAKETPTTQDTKRLKQVAEDYMPRETGKGLVWEPVDKSVHKTPPGEKGTVAGITDEDYLKGVTKEAYGDANPSPSEFMVYQNTPGDAKISRHGVFEVDGKPMEIHEEFEGEFDELQDHTKDSGRGRVFAKENRDNLYRSENKKKEGREAQKQASPNSEKPNAVLVERKKNHKKEEVYRGDDVLKGINDDIRKEPAIVASVESKKIAKPGRIDIHVETKTPQASDYVAYLLDETQPLESKKATIDELAITGGSQAEAILSKVAQNAPAEVAKLAIEALSSNGVELKTAMSEDDRHRINEEVLGQTIMPEEKNYSDPNDFTDEQVPVAKNDHINPISPKDLGLKDHWTQYDPNA